MGRLSKNHFLAIIQPQETILKLPLLITPLRISVKRNQNRITFRYQNFACTETCLGLKLSSFRSWFSMHETSIKLSHTLHWRQLHSHSCDISVYSFHMLECPCSKIFKATNGGRKLGHRLPVVALSSGEKGFQLNMTSS